MRLSAQSVATPEQFTSVCVTTRVKLLPCRRTDAQRDSRSRRVRTDSSWDSPSGSSCVLAYWRIGKEEKTPADYRRPSFDPPEPHWSADQRPVCQSLRNPENSSRRAGAFGFEDPGGEGVRSRRSPRHRLRRFQARRLHLVTSISTLRAISAWSTSTRTARCMSATSGSPLIGFSTRKPRHFSGSGGRVPRLQPLRIVCDFAM